MKTATGTAEEVLKILAYELPDKLKQLSTKDPRDEFCKGQMNAIAECIQMLSIWQYAPIYGLNTDFEKKYNIE